MENRKIRGWECLVVAMLCYTENFLRKSLIVKNRRLSWKQYDGVSYNVVCFLSFDSIVLWQSGRDFHLNSISNDSSFSLFIYGRALSVMTTWPNRLLQSPCYFLIYAAFHERRHNVLVSIITSRERATSNNCF